MSEQVERRLVELLGHPTESPYGNPIPGLDQLGDVPARQFEEGVVGLVRRLNDAGEPITGTVRRLAESAQVDPELLQQLKSAGVVPGARGDYRYNEGYVLVQMEGIDEGSNCPSRWRRTSSSSTSHADVTVVAASVRSPERLSGGQCDRTVIFR